MDPRGWIDAMNLTTKLEGLMEADGKNALTAVPLSVLFLALIAIDSRTAWIFVEIFMATVFGLSFAAFPNEILGLQTTGALNMPEITLARLYGITLFCSGITWYSTRATRDATVTISLMMSRVVASSMLLMAQAFTWWSTSSSDKKASVKWGEQFVWMFMFPTGLWLLGNLVYLCRSHDFSQYPQHNIRLNNHLCLDAWFMLLLGAAWLAFPCEIISTLGFENVSEVSRHVARSIGALHIGEAIVSLQAPGFLHSRDKQQIFLTHMISAGIKLVGLSVYFYLDGMSLVSFACIISVVLALFLNSVIGYVADGTVVYTPQKVRPHGGKAD